ncbi:restriction endonuclease subunit S [Solwaraspora sp. WMMD937]|uniref:restriction endonuclease subunit S n=1 Tax=Solwaraspora sp. WMMD937 TaxID=3016090 RepID=UPI00249AF5F1|nr:restriction endonuclease subunit S [Solwaraspora sp. WMMD937]WFE22802.1 restriction endonuclease subunit S [Solwaraspora sp. WMMD937]
MNTLIGSVPDNWQIKRLEECCDVQPGPSGTTLKASAYVIEGVPVVRASDIGPEGISPRPSKSVGEETAERLRRRYELCSGDILLVRIGVTTRHAVVTERQERWLLGGSCIRIRATQDISADYLACYFTHPAVQEWLAEHTQRGVLPTINAAKIRSMPLALPPAVVQRSVVEVAKAIDTKIRAHEDVIQATRTLRELLMPRLLAGDPVSPEVSVDRIARQLRE